MKKHLKIVIFNILLIVIIFIIADFLAFILFFKEKQNFCTKLKEYKKFHLEKISNYEMLIQGRYKNDNIFREVENIESANKSILIMGCSYAYGHELNKEETFSAQLGNITKRPIYNRALSGRGIQHALYQLKNDDFYNIVKKPEIVIYVYIKGQLNRLYRPPLGLFNSRYGTTLYYTYNLKCEDKLKETLNKYPLYYVWLRFTDKYTQKINNKKRLKYLKKNFLECRKEIDKHWGKDVKFVILLYEPLNKKQKQIFEDLEKENFIVLDINTISNKNFQSAEYQISSTDKHPNARAWKELTPLIVNKLNIK